MLWFYGSAISIVPRPKEKLKDIDCRIFGESHLDHDLGARLLIATTSWNPAIDYLIATIASIGIELALPKSTSAVKSDLSVLMAVLPHMNQNVMPLFTSKDAERAKILGGMLLQALRRQVA